MVWRENPPAEELPGEEVREALIESIPATDNPEEPNPSEKIIAGWKDEIAKIEAAIREGRASEFGGSKAAEQQILNLEDRIRDQENTWKYRAQVIDVSKFEEVENKMQREGKAVAEKSPDDDTPLPIAGDKSARQAIKKEQEESVARRNARKEAREAAEKEKVDFSKAQNLEQLYALVRKKGPLTGSHGETFPPEQLIQFIKDGNTAFITNENGGLRDVAEKLIKKETYFSGATSLEDLYSQIKEYYAGGNKVEMSSGEAYPDAETLIIYISQGIWGSVTGQMGIREAAMRLKDKQIWGEGTERRKPGFFGRLFGKK